MKELLEKYPDINAENIHAILQKEVGLVFVHVLEDAGVYKCTPKGREDFMRLWTVYRTYFDRDYNECCGMKFKTTEQENIL